MERKGKKENKERKRERKKERKTEKQKRKERKKERWRARENRGRAEIVMNLKWSFGSWKKETSQQSHL